MGQQLKSGRSRRRGAVARHVVGFASRLPGRALVVMIGYLTVLTAAARRAVKEGATRTPLTASPSRHFVVLIPAHNEEQLIGLTLKSLAEVDYPSELFAVHVVADNCTDATSTIARMLGAEAHERDEPDDPGKGPALEWLMERLQERGDKYDAVVFVDADTTVSPNFLRVADAALARGATVVQTYYAVRDPAASPAIAFRAAALAARNYLRPLGRNRIGGTAGLYGNGMVFTAECMRTRRWSNHLTEDTELQLDLLLDGTRVVFAADAVVEAEMPATLDAAQTQHERWERGRLELARRYVPRLARRVVKGGPAGRVAYADAAVDQLVPPFSVLVAGTVAYGAVAAGRAVLHPSAASRRALAVAGALTAGQTVYVLSALRMVDAPPTVYRSLLGAPRMVVWKVGLWLRVLARRRGVTWVRTARNPSGESR